MVKSRNHHALARQLGKKNYNFVETKRGLTALRLDSQLLFQCYHDASQVTDELVEKILRPGLEPGAADVFLEFICYSDGPLPEELLPEVQVCAAFNICVGV